jgi:hypothetical protein
MAEGKAQTVEQHTKLPARAQRPNVRLVRVTSNLAAGSSRQIPALPVMGKRDGQTSPEMCPHCNSEIPNHAKKCLKKKKAFEARLARCEICKKAFLKPFLSAHMQRDPDNTGQSLNSVCLA